MPQGRCSTERKQNYSIVKTTSANNTTERKKINGHALIQLIFHPASAFLSNRLSEVAPGVLIQLDSFEQGLEVSGAESLVIVSLDHFQENGGSILQRLAENLQQVAIVIIVHKDIQGLERQNHFKESFNWNDAELKYLENVHIFGNFHFGQF